MTADDLYEHPMRDYSELVLGQLRVSEPPGGEHGDIAARLLVRLHVHVAAARLGIVLVESGFLLRRAPDTVRGPDVSFVADGRLAGAKLPSSYLPFAPDVAAEVLSPNDRYAEVAEKIDDYLKAGTKLVWVIDPRVRMVTIHRPDRAMKRLSDAGFLEGEEVVPGFRCPIIDILPPINFR
jgi:Uma2 family endonuclease